MTEEWGPWIEHDGKGCPCVGMLVHTVNNFGAEMVSIAGSHPEFNHPRRPQGSWNWQNNHICTMVVRYRFRKPRALLDLIERAKELDDAPEGPVRVKPQVPA